MSKDKKSTIEVQGAAISIISQNEEDFISLTDMTRKFGDETLIYSWMRNRNTLEFIGIWEQIHNPDFKGIEFETFKTQAGLNSSSLTARKWIEATAAIGIRSKAGRYGGAPSPTRTSPLNSARGSAREFKLYLIKEFQRLKDDENRRLSLAWNLNRTLSKLNYRIHTDAIKARLIPAAVTPAQAALVYASEADLLNVALFGQTAKQWREANPKLEGNLREHAAIEQLLVLANIEAHERRVIHMGLPQGERLKRLNEIAIRQMQTLTAAQPFSELPKEKK